MFFFPPPKNLFIFLDLLNPILTVQESRQAIFFNFKVVDMMGKFYIYINKLFAASDKTENSRKNSEQRHKNRQR